MIDSREGSGCGWFKFENKHKEIGQYRMDGGKEVEGVTRSVASFWVPSSMLALVASEKARTSGCEGRNLVVEAVEGEGEVEGGEEGGRGKRGRVEVEEAVEEWRSGWTRVGETTARSVAVSVSGNGWWKRKRLAKMRVARWRGGRLCSWREKDGKVGDKK